MKGLKFRFYVVMILATLSLVSVGFASWIASESISESVNGLIVVEDVRKVNEYITCSSEDITMFRFFKTGFVNSDGSISTTGNITANLTIDLDTCGSEFSDCNTLEVQIDLMQENFALFNSQGNLTKTVIVKKGSETITSLTTTNETMCVTTFDVPITSGDVEIQVVYSFTIENLDYYKTNVYPKLLNDEFNFILSAKLTGKKVTS